MIGVPAAVTAAAVKSTLTCTDLGNADRFIRLHGDGYRYCPELGS